MGPGSLKSWNVPLVGLMLAIPFLASACPNSAGPLDAGINEDRICSGPASSELPTFGSPIPLVADGGDTFGRNVAAGDVDGDGIPDLLVPSGNEYVYTAQFSNIVFGLGDGGLSAPQHFGASSFAAPFDADGGAALASINILGTGILVYGSDGEEIWSHATATYALGFAVADLNLDGKPDLVVCESTGIEAVLNLGHRTFDDPKPLAPGACGAVAAGDLNLDGVPDLVVLGSASSVVVMLGKQDGGFSSSSYPSGSLDYGGSAVVLRDLNGDGLPDIVAADIMGVSGDHGFGLPALYVFLNRGQGLFGDPISYPFGTTAGLSQQLAVSDFNGDCWPDLLATRDVGCDPSLPGLYLFLNSGDGTFAPPMPLPSAGGQGVAAYRAAGALLPSIAVTDACVGRFQILSNLTKP